MRVFGMVPVDRSGRVVWLLNECGVDHEWVKLSWRSGDLNTPDTSSSGFLDGMAISALTGSCWQEETARIADFAAIPGRNVYLLGARDLDPPEADLLVESLKRSHCSEKNVPSENAYLQPMVNVISEMLETLFNHGCEVLDCAALYDLWRLAPVEYFPLVQIWHQSLPHVQCLASVKQLIKISKDQALDCNRKENVTDVLEGLDKKPACLKELCCQTVFTSLKGAPIKAVEKLPLPKSLQSVVLCKHTDAINQKCTCNFRSVGFANVIA